MIKSLSHAQAAAPKPNAAASESDSDAPATPPSLPGGASAADRAWICAAVAQFEVPLTQYATRLLAGDVERARDVVQDAFLKLWTADRATVDGHLGQWLYRVCRNRALDVRRKESRMTVLKDEAAQTLADNRERKGEKRERDPEFAPAHELAGTTVLALLESLNDTQQEVLRLTFQGGLSYKEIASVMDITSNHVGVLIHHAIKALRERMAAHSQPHVETGRAQA